MSDTRLPEMPPIITCAYVFQCTDYQRLCSTCENNKAPKKSYFEPRE